MASEIINKIKSQIKIGNNFLISGGAGSGKTYSLMKVIDLIYEIDSSSTIACITFTNIAANEIKHRAKHEKLEVFTIHDFLWKSIKNYQNDLKKSLVDLVIMEKEVEKSGIKYTGEKDISIEYLQDKEINYKDYRKIDNGILSHDDIFKISNYMFKTYPLLCDVLKDKYGYILIDEYQDTEEQVIDIFLKYLPKSNDKKNIIGFFGDSMQSIYSNRIGDLKQYIKDGLVFEIKKNDNWRCSETVIDLLNKIRTDDIQQTRKRRGDEIDIDLSGSAKFIYSNAEDIDFESIKINPLFEHWDFNDVNETKELYLTHNLIADKAGFGKIFQIYNNDEIIKQVKKIKKKSEEGSSLDDIKSKTFEEVLNMDIAKETLAFQGFISENGELFNQTKSIFFEELSRIRLNTDQLIGNNSDKLCIHLKKIQERIDLYETKQVNEFTRKVDYKILSINDKKELKSAIDTIVNQKNETIETIVNLADSMNIVKKDDNFTNFINENQYVYDRVKSLPFTEITNLYKFEEKKTPYSTQHGIKGAEFNNVFVILDNGKWNLYNFKHFFEETARKESIVERTNKMFYVCCSRAKKNLIVFYHQPSGIALTKAKEWFGPENVLEI
ncbi:UvrD/REP helicase [Bathymodiolus thermophilus thioautotrophic gill symbiont]|uniref:UvrD/REP helicase n=1 Tax=Bathymodiolus thermophilus thioautotrophic gill symbiont TaxID=2360 RepID=A0A3G3ILJ8_9GAMM|nr:ATP-dependent helicase [Bathymodiolus thermophilus thioautotrophic gill symbiont]AYQ56454.1 UvrD/REP helicase [Bathymodiolus thermophilus thioautotrophic gill symbiont]